MLFVQPTFLTLFLPEFTHWSPLLPSSDPSLSVFFIVLKTLMLYVTSSKPSGAPSVDVVFFLMGSLKFSPIDPLLCCGLKTWMLFIASNCDSYCQLDAQNAHHSQCPHLTVMVRIMVFNSYTSYIHMYMKMKYVSSRLKFTVVLYVQPHL